LRRAADRSRWPTGDRGGRPALARSIERGNLRGARGHVGATAPGRPGREPARAHPVGDHVRFVTLEGLDETETGELARSVAGATVDAEDVRRLYARTGGNPLFIGETVRAIVDEGAITSDGRLE